MRIAVLGDLHLISPDADVMRRRLREHFALTQASFRQLTERIRAEQPEMIIPLGDLVDWCCPANLHYGTAMLRKLEIPWHLVPGNHDLSRPDFIGEGVNDAQAKACEAWRILGVDLSNRFIDLEDTRLILLDSALGTIEEDALEWLDEATNTDRRVLLFTHVPLHHEQIAKTIHRIDPRKNLQKYMQQQPCFQTHIQGRIDAVFTGHLHFAAYTDIDGTACHMLPLSITAHEAHYPDQGHFSIIELSAEPALHTVNIATGCRTTHPLVPPTRRRPHAMAPGLSTSLKKTTRPR
ncbi:MAG: metallophosphoesterase [Phycisphaeraceae bacterium]|nr:metallophosphoesterase [Phycisphaeraceae bacterium]